MTIAEGYKNNGLNKYTGKLRQVGHGERNPRHGGNLSLTPDPICGLGWVGFGGGGCLGGEF